MVSFGLKLKDNVREQWREYYISYELLKRILKKIKRRAGGGGGDSDSDEVSGPATPSNLIKMSVAKKKKKPEKVLTEAVHLLEAGQPLNYETALQQENEESEELHQEFKAAILSEVEKVEMFYNAQTEELSCRLETLVGQLREGRKVLEAQGSTTNLSGLEASEAASGASEGAGSGPPRMAEEDLKAVLKRQSPGQKEYIEKTLIELSREMALLQNYTILNYTGFIKILKKHDKLDDARALRPEVLPLIEQSSFFKHTSLDDLITKVTTLFAMMFCNSDANQARALMLPKRSTVKTDYFLLQMGYKLGVAATLAFWVVWDCVVQVAKFGKPTIVVKQAFPVYRAVGGLLLLHWCWGLLEQACNIQRINYVYLLDLNPKSVSSPRWIFDEAVNESIIYLSSMLLYYKVLVGGFPAWIEPGYYPLMLVLYTFWCLLRPWKQRKGLWMVMGRVVTAPLTSVTFLDTLVADALTSLVKVLLDLVWSIAYFISGDFLRDVSGAAEETMGLWEHSYLYSKVLAPIVVILPLWWRFMQCLRRYHDTNQRWPHLANATKYALAQTVTLFGAFHRVYYTRNGTRSSSYAYDIIWVFITVFSTCYSYIWDVTQDWGLGDPHKRFLNDRRMYSRDWPYYLAIVLDLFLRFLWVNTLIPPGSGGLLSFPLYLNAALMVLEILRRMGWGVLRLENEQLRNTQGFRRVDVIPLSFSTETAHEYKDVKKLSNLKIGIELALVAAFVILMSIGAVVVADSIDSTGQ